MHTKKLNGVIFKINFEKAYDKVNWSFLQHTLRMKGFSEEWCALIHNFVSGNSVAVKVNDDIDRYFQTKEGLRQGDPVSPILFNIVAGMLVIMIERAKDNGQFEGVVPHLVDGGLSILQYADDTIVFMEHDSDKAVNMKLIPSAFEQLSGLRLISMKVNCFALARLKMQQLSMPKYLDVSKVNFLFGIWESLYIIGG
jgi:hypothetical protein